LARPTAEEAKRRKLLLDEGLKPCSKCERVLPLSAFCGDSNTTSGFASVCRECVARYWQENKVQLNEYQRRYRAEHKEERARHSYDYWREHKENQQAYHREYRKINATRIRQREEIKAPQRRAHNRRYYEENKERLVERHRVWAQTAAAQASHRQRQQVRRMAKAGLPNTYTLEEWQYALAWFDGCCAYCGLVVAKPQQDHVIPVTAGGAYVVENIVPACKRCNCSKSDLSLGDWALNGGATFLVPGALERIEEYQAMARSAG